MGIGSSQEEPSEEKLHSLNIKELKAIMEKKGINHAR